jgi:hypothetical protein
MTRVHTAGVLVVLALAVPLSAAGQVTVTLAQAPPTLEVLEAVESDAAQTRAQLQRLLAQHPPALRTVLRADPSLISNSDYLQPYPRLAAFLREHPEVVRDPSYFLGGLGPFYWTEPQTPQQRAISMIEDLLVGLAVFTVILTIALVLGSLIRQALTHRRWLRQSRVQTDVHTKILDRLQSNEELLAYIQTPAGQRFLEAGPSPQAAEPWNAGAPYARILWSVQAGVMLGALGVAMWIVQQGLMQEIALIFRAIGIVALMLGIGAVVSAGLSYALSVRLGLIGSPKGS